MRRFRGRAMLDDMLVIVGCCPEDNGMLLNVVYVWLNHGSLMFWRMKNDALRRFIECKTLLAVR